MLENVLRLAPETFLHRDHREEYIFSTPSQYPAQRLTYDLFPYSQTAEKHGLRLFKVSIREQVWNLVEMGPEMESFAKTQLENQRRLPPDITGLGELLDFDVTMAGNRYPPTPLANEELWACHETPLPDDLKIGFDKQVLPSIN
ncbi:hypothetical protein I350_03282 [Cryptococcus amylolentus CBS 6273]|uniref:Uncharacterized protein n=1 Tax=Cryptococcus amylolentus CBS 6273 TaxID=1296118 RepID=A0A1E3K3S4_9TREE|nr:hypothetical protein I350_03282 [Cryptococcus amylolentus CBS 6273]